jgi:DNA primase
VDSDLCDRVFAALLDLCPLRTCATVAAYVDNRGVYADAESVGIGALPESQDAQNALIGQLAERVGGMEALVNTGLARSVREPSLRAPRHLLLIPWRGRDGRVSTIQRRRLDAMEPRYLFPSRIAPSDPFGADLISSAQGALGEDAPVVVTEGALDCLARRKIARVSGEAVVAIGAPSATTAHAEWSALFKGRHVIVAFDADNAGDEGARRFAATCLAGARLVERERPRQGDWNETLLRVLRSKEVLA